MMIRSKHSSRPTTSDAYLFSSPLLHSVSLFIATPHYQKLLVSAPPSWRSFGFAQDDIFWNTPRDRIAVRRSLEARTLSPASSFPSWSLVFRNTEERTPSALRYAARSVCRSLQVSSN